MSQSHSLRCAVGYIEGVTGDDHLSGTVGNVSRLPAAVRLAGSIRIWTIAGTLLGLLAMHGASAGHVVTMPMPHSAEAAGHAATLTLSANVSPRLAGMVVRDEQHWRVPLRCAPAGRPMHHNDGCVTTLRPTAQPEAPTAISLGAVMDAALGSHSALWNFEPGRDSPATLLTRLCISRT